MISLLVKNKKKIHCLRQHSVVDRFHHIGLSTLNVSSSVVKTIKMTQSTRDGSVTCYNIFEATISFSSYINYDP